MPAVKKGLGSFTPRIFNEMASFSLIYFVRITCLSTGEKLLEQTFATFEPNLFKLCFVFYLVRISLQIFFLVLCCLVLQTPEDLYLLSNSFHSNKMEMFLL